MAQKEILIVDKNDDIIDFGYKIPVHEKGLLHRAFSVIIFNDKNEMLLQRRATNKYHSPGLWTNACCGHPFNKKTVCEYAQQRLIEEMGINCKLSFSFKFSYSTKFNNGLTENEIDHVFIGITNKNPVLNLQEADNFKWITKKQLYHDLQKNPSKYTSWFRILMKKINLNYSWY